MPVSSHTLNTRNPRGVTPLHNCPLSAPSPQSRILSTRIPRVSKTVTPTTIPVTLRRHLRFPSGIALFSVTKIPHACNRFRETRVDTMMLGARTIGNSKINEYPGSFIQ